MSTELSTTPDEQPAPAVLDEFVGAQFWIRALGRIIDWAVHYALWFVASFVFVFGLVVYARMTGLAFEPLIDRLSGGSTWHDYVASILGLVAYHTIMEWMCGATVGKRILGLIVTDTDGKSIGIGAALGRSLAFYVDGLFFGIPAYDSMKSPPHQRLGDKWAKTLVLKRATLARQRVVVTRSFAMALFVGLLSDAVCCFVAAWIKL